MNCWEKIWNEKGAIDDNENFEGMSAEAVFCRLKELMGITVFDGNGVTVNDFVVQFERNIREMIFSPVGNFEPQSFFDLGCGTGSYLFLLQKKFPCAKLGGADFSKGFIGTASRVIANPLELCDCEASGIDTSLKYDVVYSRSIFQYFPDKAYAEKVVRLMLAKSNYSTAILDVHDIEKEQEFLDYRRSKVEDYDKKYSDTRHLFLPKEMFLKIAAENNCSVKFAHSHLPGYWNDRFTYDVYMFRENALSFDGS